MKIGQVLNFANGEIYRELYKQNIKIKDMISSPFQVHCKAQD